MMILVAALAVSVLVAGSKEPARQPDAPLTLEAAQALVLVAADHFDRRTGPEAARRLARAFADGNPFATDAALACSFATLAAINERMTMPAAIQDLRQYDAWMAAADAFAERYCGVLAPNELRGAMNSMGCFAIGMPRDLILLNGVAVNVDRNGIGPVDRSNPFTLPNCPFIVSSVRPVTAAAVPSGPAAPHFVEVFYWARGLKEGAPTFVLHHLLLELEKGALHMVHFDPAYESSSWPSSLLDLRSWYDLAPDGRVRYELAGIVTKRGWIERSDR